MTRRIGTPVAVLVALLGLAAGPAGADAVGESDRSSDLVLQAIALAVNTPDDIAAIREKVGDALEAPKKQGVDLDLVRRADEALTGEELHRARKLLERSIGARAHRGVGEPAPIREVGPPPKGAEPGRALPVEPLAGRSGFGGSAWATLVAAIAVGLAGLALSVRYRPRHAEVAR